jgi:diguanylate cyclase (GGDEF)-like protein
LTGDKVLCEFATICVQNLRDSDLFARIGGEEFAAVIHSSDLHIVIRVAERIRAAFSRIRVEIEGKTLPFEPSVSIGLVEVDPEHDSVESGLKRADIALYRAKSQGRNQVVAD